MLLDNPITTLDCSDPRVYHVDQTEPAPKEAKRLFDFIASQMEDRSHTLLEWPQYSLLKLTMLQARLLFIQGNWNGSRIVNEGKKPDGSGEFAIMCFTPSGAMEVQIGGFLVL